MKKKIIFVLVSVVIIFTSVACGKESIEEESTVAVDVSGYSQEELAEEIETKEIETEEIETEEVETEEVETVDSKREQVACYVSKRKVSEFIDSFPDNICTDFSYFVYDDYENGPRQAQKHLEVLGVSEEGKRLVVRLVDNEEEMPVHLIFQEYLFDESVVKIREHYFMADINSYNRALEEIDNVAEEDEIALYFCTEFYEESSLTYDIVLGQSDGIFFETIW